MRPSERPFSEPTPAVRRWQRDRRHDWCFLDLRPGQPPDGKLDGGEGDEGCQGFRRVLEILGKPVAGCARTTKRCARAPSGAAGQRIATVLSFRHLSNYVLTEL
jgi:hypothetical protein